MPRLPNPDLVVPAVEFGCPRGKSAACCSYAEKSERRQLGIPEGFQGPADILDSLEILFVFLGPGGLSCWLYAGQWRYHGTSVSTPEVADFANPVRSCFEPRGFRLFNSVKLPTLRHGKKSKGLVDFSKRFSAVSEYQDYIALPMNTNNCDLQQNGNDCQTGLLQRDPALLCVNGQVWVGFGVYELIQRISDEDRGTVISHPA